MEETSFTIMDEFQKRNSDRMERINSLMRDKLFSDKCKMYEIKKLVNQSTQDYFESRRKIDEDFSFHTPLQCFLLHEDF